MSHFSFLFPPLTGFQPLQIIHDQLFYYGCLFGMVLMLWDEGLYFGAVCRSDNSDRIQSLLVGN